MKIEKNDNNLIVFLNKKISPKIDLNNKIELEKNFQKLFKKLNDIYDLKLNGSYEMDIYLNKEYGMILELQKEEIEYFDYYDTIDMHLNLSKYDEILYKTNDIIQNNMYIYNGEIYIEPQDTDFKTLGIIIENSEIIYGKKAHIIKKKGKKIITKNYKVEKIK